MEFGSRRCPQLPSLPRSRYFGSSPDSIDLVMWKLKKFTPLAPANVVVKAEPATVYDILTDYDNYLDWFPVTNHSKLMVKEGDDLAIAEFECVKPSGAKLTMECIHTRNEMVLN